MLGALQGVDERDRVAEGGEQDVAARLVRLRLDREPDVVALVGHVVAEQVDGLPVALQRGTHVFRRVVLRALATTPHDERARTELCAQVELTEHLAQREAAHLAVVRGEAAVLEDRGAEQVRGDHRHDETRVGERTLEAVDLRLALGIRRPEGEEVVIVEGETVGAELRQLLDGVHDVEGRTRRTAEGVGAVVSDGPETERELVGAGRGEAHDAPSHGRTAACAYMLLTATYTEKSRMSSLLD